MANFRSYNGVSYGTKKINQSGYVFLLYLSFVWLTFFSSVNSFISNLYFDFGKLFVSTDQLFSTIYLVLIYALLELAVFEILFWIYRNILSCRIYTFVVPDDKMKVEFRLYFILRNVILGVITNLCFLYPFLYNAYDFFKIFVTLLIIILFAFNIQKKYSEPIIAHFVFRNFYKPVLLYEIVMGLYYFWSVI